MALSSAIWLESGLLGRVGLSKLEQLLLLLVARLLTKIRAYRIIFVEKSPLLDVSRESGYL